MPLWIQILILVIYVLGFFFVFEFFSRCSYFEDEEEPERHHYAIAVVCAAFWPLMLVLCFALYLAFIIWCLLYSFSNNK